MGLSKRDSVWLPPRIESGHKTPLEMALPLLPRGTFKPQRLWFSPVLAVKPMPAISAQKVEDMQPSAISETAGQHGKRARSDAVVNPIKGVNI